MAVFTIRGGREGQFKGVNPALMSILRAAAAAAPPSISKVELFSGQAARSSGSFNHPRGWATDLTLYDASGKPIDNFVGNPFGVKSPSDIAAFRVYEQFAQTARQVQRRDHPKLTDRFRWGGYFKDGTPGDLMHFDLSGGMSRKTGPQTDRWKNGLQVGRWIGVSKGAAAISPTAMALGAQPAPTPAVAAANDMAAGVPSRTLKLTGQPGRNRMQGDDVRQLQQKLASAGLYKGKVDGVFGPETDKAVRSFQTNNPGLAVDGKAGPKTMAALGPVQSFASPYSAAAAQGTLPADFLSPETAGAMLGGAPMLPAAGPDSADLESAMAPSPYSFQRNGVSGGISGGAAPALPSLTAAFPGARQTPAVPPMSLAGTLTAGGGVPGATDTVNMRRTGPALAAPFPTPRPARDGAAGKQSAPALKPGPFGAEELIRAAETGDPTRIKAAMDRVSANVLNDVGYAGAGAAKAKIQSYLTGAVTANPELGRTINARVKANPGMLSVLPADTAKQVKSALAALPAAPTAAAALASAGVPLPTPRPATATETLTPVETPPAEPLSYAGILGTLEQRAGIPDRGNPLAGSRYSGGEPPAPGIGLAQPRSLYSPKLASPAMSDAETFDTRFGLPSMGMDPDNAVADTRAALRNAMAAKEGDSAVAGAPVGFGAPGIGAGLSAPTRYQPGSIGAALNVYGDLWNRGAAALGFGAKPATAAPAGVPMTGSGFDTPPSAEEDEILGALGKAVADEEAARFSGPMGWPGAGQPDGTIFGGSRDDYLKPGGPAADVLSGGLSSVDVMRSHQPGLGTGGRRASSFVEDRRPRDAFGNPIIDNTPWHMKTYPQEDGSIRVNGDRRYLPGDNPEYDEMWRRQEEQKWQGPIEDNSREGMDYDPIGPTSFMGGGGTTFFGGGSDDILKGGPALAKSDKLTTPSYGFFNPTPMAGQSHELQTFAPGKSVMYGPADSYWGLGEAKPSPLGFGASPAGASEGPGSNIPGVTFTPKVPAGGEPAGLPMYNAPPTGMGMADAGLPAAYHAPAFIPGAGAGKTETAWSPSGPKKASAPGGGQPYDGGRSSGGAGAGGAIIPSQSYGGSPGAYSFAGMTPWGSAVYSMPGGGFGNSPFTPAGYTAPNFNPVSGGNTYAYQPNGQGGGTYITSNGTVMSY